MTTKVSIVSPTQAASQSLVHDIQALERTADVRVQVGGVEMACNEIAQSSPDLLVMEMGQVESVDLHMLEQALINRHGTSLILLTPDRSADTLLGAMRAGIREVVPTPLVNGEFKAAYARQMDRMRATGRTASGHTEGDVLAFMPTKGGAGATFLATSFAHALSTRSKRVAVIDLNMVLGDAAIFLSEKPVTATIADLAQQEKRLDGALLESVMIKCDEHLWLLASPESADSARAIRAETVAHIIALARNRYDYVVLDMSRAPDNVSLRALDVAKTVYLVAQTNLPFLHDAKRQLALLNELGYTQGKLELVLNRVDKRGALTPADFRKTLHFDQAREIPNSYGAVSYAINHGLPILRHLPRDPVARAINAWADEWVPAVQEARSTWLGGLGIGR